MNVLNLVTTRSPVFKKQVQSLQHHDINIETISVPGEPGNRTVSNYIQFYIQSIRSLSSQYDLIHANYGLTAPMALAQPIRPIVLTLWGDDLMGEYGPMTKQCAKYVSEVIVRSEEMNRELERDTHVIPSGVNLNLFEPIEGSKAKSDLGWEKEVDHVLFPYDPSRANKNYSLAESVVKTVDEKRENPTTLSVVKGVPHEQVPLYMNAADALLLTSNREGSPNTVKEAMACNTPVVSTDVGDVCERLEGVSQSAVCQNKDELVGSLISVLNSDERSDGRKHVKEVGLERIGEEIASVYRQALYR